MGCHGAAGTGGGDRTFNPPGVTLSSMKMSTQLQSAEGLEPGGKAHRVVMHLNSGEEKVQKGMLNNIRNLYDAVGAERLDVELVAHGAGLSLFIKQDAKLIEELEKLKALYGVSYTACSNTMKAQGLTRADLVDQVDRTMPAMVRLMELQEQGWVYIKP
jgi:intracellular sulfur oxidation DsrE/DsrF family protein